ncbi:MAG: HAD-IB family hydrolase [Candidatus Nanoarchaeia archaeon]|nr:HAD-IB family hydrolase [Candidatus Nanoarchaeia archaeon]MDD5053883.1 HAD-IB family hydrolase [Candidatus Nanoarchaeia archaeon]MDD5500023.1 HAD-IB family hydrolase [Candidatus Nanoarchaeia archaeon]
MAIGAFFDLDGTIIKGNSGLRFMRFLYNQKALKAKKSAIIPGIKLAYSYLKGDFMGAVDRADNLMALSFKGAEKKQIKKFAKIFAKNDSKNFLKKIMQIAEWHKKKGHKLVLLSVSPEDLVKEFGKILKFHASAGSKFREKNGIYTGELITPSMVGKERALVAKKIAKTLKIDFKKSYSYGNCINDLQVLELAKNPFAVNPNKHLSKIARKKGFRII